MIQEQRESYKEVLTILDHMDLEYKEKVPKKLIEFFERNTAEDYDFKLDPKKSFQEQELKEKTISLLAMLYLSYWCKDENEKQELILKYTENEKIYEDNLEEMYGADRLFKNKNKNENQLTKTEKTTILRKIKEFFKKIFNQKKKNL